MKTVSSEASLLIPPVLLRCVGPTVGVDVWVQGGLGGSWEMRTMDEVHSVNDVNGARSGKEKSRDQ